MTGLSSQVKHLKIVFVDNHCLVVDKPAGMLVEHDENHPAQRGLESALGVAKAMLKEMHKKPGNVFLQPVNRIDQPVSGVVVFAKTSKAASRLVEAFRERTVEKFYLAVIEGSMAAAQGQLVDFIAESPTKGIMRVVSKDTPGAKKSDLEYQVLAELPAGRQVVLIRLGTGRKHQIRVQLSHQGCPVAGDRKYGGKLSFDEGLVTGLGAGKAIALHCFRLRFPHPTRDEKCDASSPPPPFWDIIEGFRDARAETLRDATDRSDP